MCAHNASLTTAGGLKSVRKEAPPLTEKERLSYHDDDEASIVPWILGADDCFLERADTLAALPPEERAEEAGGIAKNYAPYKGPHRRLIVALLLLAAETPSALRRTRLANYSRRAVWAESGLCDLDGRRKRERWRALEDGARRLARFGAGRCIHLGCPTSLASDQFVGRTRPTHCGAHAGGLSSGIRESHRNEIREAFDAATGQRRQRRARRRA
jgi:hypothetical protein